MTIPTLFSAFQRESFFCLLIRRLRVFLCTAVSKERAGPVHQTDLEITKLVERQSSKSIQKFLV